MRNWLSQRSLRAHVVCGGAVALAVVCSPAQARTQVTVTFKETAVVERAVVRLEDIADVAGAGAGLREQLEQVTVGQLPPDGLRRVVRRDAVLRAVRKQVPAVTVNAQGATQTFVSARVTRYPAAKLIDVARGHLEQRVRAVAPQVSRLVIEPTNALTDLHVAGGDVEILPRPLTFTAPGKRICVWLDVRLAGKPYRSIPVWMNVEAYAPVLVTARAFAPREEIPQGAVAQAERDIANVRGNLLARDADLAGHRARFHIPAGAVLRANDVEPSPAVLADQEVDVRVAVGSVVVETKAVAQEEGRVGDYIRVRNPSSASMFMARVVGDKSVMVTER